MQNRSRRHPGSIPSIPRCRNRLPRSAQDVSIDNKTSIFDKWVNDCADALAVHGAARHELQEWHSQQLVAMRTTMNVQRMTIDILQMRDPYRQQAVDAAQSRTIDVSSESGLSRGVGGVFRF